MWQGERYACPINCPCRLSAGYPRATVYYQTAPNPHPMSIAEQMGDDPMSKLTAALHDLADALRSAKGD